MRKVFRKKDKCGLSSHSHQAMDQGWGLQTTSPCASVNSLWDLTIWTGPWCMKILLAQIITQSTSLAVPIPPPICPALRGEGRGVCPTPGKPTVYLSYWEDKRQKDSLDFLVQIGGRGGLGALLEDLQSHLAWT